MTIVQIFLLAAGSLSLGAGAAYLLWPIEMAGLMDFLPTTQTGVIEVQGFYGGQIMGLGVVALLGASQPKFVVPALVLLVASVGGTAIGRLLGVITSGSCPAFIAALLLLESATAIFAALLLRVEWSEWPEGADLQAEAAD